MKKRFLVGLMAGMLMVGVAGVANALIIDFKTLEHNDTNKTALCFSYSENGYTLNNLSAYPFYTFGTQETFSRYPGSTALFNESREGVTELVRSNGHSFNLNSIDLAELNGNILPSGRDPFTSVTFVGFFAGGGSIAQTFTLDQYFVTNDLSSFQTISFLGFTNLVKVSWIQQADYHQFDNIVVTASGGWWKGGGHASVPQPATMLLGGSGMDGLSRGGSVPVPEPATMLLFGTGMAGFIGSRCGRKKL